MLTPLSMVIAQAKVAHIEVQKLISEMPEVIAAQELKKLEETYTADMENITRIPNKGSNLCCRCGQPNRNH